MKYLALLTLLCTAQVQAQQKLDCEDIVNDAEYAMMARQVGEPMSNVLRYFRAYIVEHAYSKPIERKYDDKVRAIELFKLTYEIKCNEVNNGR